MAENKEEMSFLEHLEELRWHIVRSVLAIIILAITAFVFKSIMFDSIILAPSKPEFFTNRLFCKAGAYIVELLKIDGSNKLCINSKPLVIQSIKMAGQFQSHIMISLIAGLIVAFPYVFWEFWRFIVPALYSKEKNVARGAVLVSSFLFMTGVLFGYFLIVPLSIHFLGSYHVSEQVQNQIHLTSYVTTITSIVLAAGIVFELPIIVYFLSKLGIVSPAFLKKYRRHAIVLILILSAIITPPDVFSQILVCMPLIILYEIGIVISRRIVKKQEEEEESSE